MKRNFSAVLLHFVICLSGFGQCPLENSIPLVIQINDELLTWGLDMRVVVQIEGIPVDTFNSVYRLGFLEFSVAKIFDEYNDGVNPKKYSFKLLFNHSLSPDIDGIEYEIQLISSIISDNWYEHSFNLVKIYNFASKKYSKLYCLSKQNRPYVYDYFYGGGGVINKPCR